jgi:plasmid stability protein
MSKTLTLRNVPDQVVERLRERAVRNQRSMQAELLAIVRAATLDRASLREHLRELRGRQASPMTLEQIEEAIHAGRP